MGESDQGALPFPSGEEAGGAPLPAAPLRRIWGVSELLAEVRQRLEQGLFDVWIEGEISNFHQAASRHCYFTLKDARGQIRAALFAQQARYLKFKPRDGLQVLARARVTVYEARGELQCQIEHLEPLGRGGLQLAFEQLKEKLAREGLFRAERKRALPRLPRRFGVITSPRGAAVADIVHTLRRRFRRLDILLYPVTVQGETAAGEIRAGLKFFAAQGAESPHRVDVVIVARGGGSLEDLWPFNDEALARQLARMPVPVISGVGHETDFTIADFVADLRAPTPTAAAELAVRPQAEFLREWATAARHLQQALRLRLLRERQRLTTLARHRAFQAVEQRLRARAQRVDELGFRLQAGWRQRLEQQRQRLALAAARVRGHDIRVRLTGVRAAAGGREQALLTAWRAAHQRRRHRLEGLAAVLEERNPLRILQRGYTLVYDAEGALVVNPEAPADGQPIRIRFASGWLEAEARRRKPVS